MNNLDKIISLAMTAESLKIIMYDEGNRKMIEMDFKRDKDEIVWAPSLSEIQIECNAGELSIPVPADDEIVTYDEESDSFEYIMNGVVYTILF